MTDTPNINLPIMEASQAQKHVTHNEAIRDLDALVHLAVLDRDLATPPLSPANGDRYLVAAGASGTWAGKDGQLAAYQDGAWSFHQPKAGWICWISDDDVLKAYDGLTWTNIIGSELQNLSKLGINTNADATNRLTVKSDGVLFSHDDVTPGTGDVRTILNKNLVAGTASFLFQTAFSGRAEIGLTGDDDFHFKVSADGMTFNEAINIDNDNGVVTLPNGIIVSTTGGTADFQGNVTVSGTVDGRDLALDGSKLDGIEAAADITDAINVAAAGASITSSGAGTPTSVPSAQGDIYVDTTNNQVYIAVGNASSNDWRFVNGDRSVGTNKLLNPSFILAQRGTSFHSTSSYPNNDNTYLLDRWILLSDGNDIVDVKQKLDGALGSYSYLEADVETIQKKFGFLQIIEQKNISDLLGLSQKVSLSFEMKVTNATKLDNIKAVVLSWTGSADAVTSDVISSWNAADTTPNWAANWVAENTPSNLNVTSSQATYKIDGIDIDTANTKNIAVFIWCDTVGNNNSPGTKLHLTDVQLELGDTATNIEPRPFDEELYRCQRYYCIGGRGAILCSFSTVGGDIGIEFPVHMRVPPTASFAPGMSSVTATIDGVGKSSTTAPSAPSLSTHGGFLRIANGFSSMTDAAAGPVTNDPFEFDAEL